MSPAMLPRGWGLGAGAGSSPAGQQSPLARIRFPAARYSVSRRVTSTPPTSREVRSYTTEPIVAIAVMHDVERSEQGRVTEHLGRGEPRLRAHAR